MDNRLTGSLVPKLNEGYVVNETVIRQTRARNMKLKNGKKRKQKQRATKPQGGHSLEVFFEKTMLENNVADVSLVKGGLKEETTSIVSSAPICKRKDKG